MTTDQATYELGGLLLYPCDDEPAGEFIDAAHRRGRAWRWEEAGLALLAAYRALDATPPAVGSGSAMAHGYAWHSGDHPIQAAARQYEAELVAR